MYTPEGRTGRTPGRLTQIVAAVAVALMGLAGVAAAAPKDEPRPEQAQPNGLPDQAQPNGPPVQAQDPAPAPQRQAKGHARQGTGAPADVPREPPPQAGGNANSGPAAGHGHQGAVRGGQGHQGAVRGGGGDHGRPSSRGGQEPPHPNAAENGGGSEQSRGTGGQHGAAGDVLGVSEERPGDDRTEPSERHAGGAPELGSALGVNQGGVEDAGEAHGSFDGALPFTGFELALLAGVGGLLGLAGVRLRRSTA